MKIIVTEKPSVAMDFSKALGLSPDGRKDGYIEDKGYIITWCVGHLIEMAYPEVYDPDMKKWDMDTLPFLPAKYIYQVIPNVKKQFNTIKKLYNRSDIETIYYAGDPAREGIYIQMLVRQEAGHNPNAKELVVWIDSQTKEEILRGIKDAGPLADKKLLSDSGYMRAIEDYAFGINFSRLLTLKYGNLLNNACGGRAGALAVGRVMTCVLGMVVSREREILNFKPTPFFRIKNTIATSGGSIDALWKVSEKSSCYQSPRLYSDTGFKEEADANAFISRLPSQVTVASIGKKEEKKNAPLLFNLTELQSECSKKLKISPDETLQVVQSLYEKKMTTYPRTDARVLSSAIAKVIDMNIRGLSVLPAYTDMVNNVLDGKVWERIGSTKYTDDSKVTDHYALIPTGYTNEYNNLSDLEKKVYDLVVRRFLSIFYPPAVYAKVRLIEKAGNEEFNSVATILADPGYMAVAGIPEQKEDVLTLKAAIESLHEGDTYDAHYSIDRGETKPPKRYTSGSMVLAMENAGNLIEDEELREQTKGSGIGTTATRAEIIKKLVANDYLALNKKTQILTPAPYGNMVYEVVNLTMPDLLSPKMTASWEKGLESIVDGTVTSGEYRQKLEAYIRRKCSSIKEQDVCEQIAERIRPFAKVKEFDNNPGERKFVPRKVKKSDVNVYLNVPYEDRDKVKELGARWDGTHKCWYVPAGEDESKFSKWKQAKTAPDNKKRYLKVPYDDRDKVKALGARWDKDKKSWYFIGAENKDKFAKWL